ncbi:MAG TPA: phenylalanine--tRNA ligase subunit beta [Verrucomicrobiota bacterium]|nr:phenylalanine--tRNA ligase subunit beta [Verrucomicrobiales bacterium]HRI16603.1 phenylalanine--tRNA ligase subunit beta [Verrucomicrobiota bacterium]
MKVTLNWLKQYIDYPGTPEELVEHLTQLGLEVEGVEKRAGEFAGISVAQVLTREKHPNADKLSVCRVADGQGERQIVCGADNFKPGDKVALIFPGQALPQKPGDTQPFVIKVGKIRGVESHGMMCSAEELGINPEAIDHQNEEGLLILRPDALVGQPLAEYLGRPGSDVVFDLEITPNRPDLNSVVGIARELAAVTSRPLRIPEVPTFSDAAGENADSLVRVVLEATDLCPRYAARVVRGIQVGPSPTWLRNRLEMVGLRSVNNVVDVTNFVMLEMGQPLHAFDLHRVAQAGDGRPTIVVRRAAAGEKFTTLDGKTHELTSDNLLIADSSKGIALAGVMGGQNSEITGSTVDVLVESAYFSPTNVRRTSKALGLRTDASYRFERGTDPNACDLASRRCVQLILETAGGTAVAGAVDAYPSPIVPITIPLRYHRANELLGLELSGEQIAAYLGRLDLPPKDGVSEPANDATAELATFVIPTYRVDLKREVDLIEEVARLHGVERIPATAPRGALGAHVFDARYDELARVREILIGLGLSEVQGQTLVSSGETQTIDGRTLARLDNPLSSDMDCLRPSLLPGLLTILRHNLNRKNGDLQLFEVGRVFSRDGAALKEGWRVALALTGLRQSLFWSGADRDQKCDIFDLKGTLEELLERMGMRGVVWVPRAASSGLFLESAQVMLGGKLFLGELGQVLPNVARQYDLRDPVLLAELDLDQLLARANPSKAFKPLPQFPAVRRDIAMLVPETVTHESVLAAVRQAKPAQLERVELFDVFRGRHVPAGQKSLAYAFTYRAVDRTLKDEEVNQTHAKVVETLKSVLKAHIRE